MFLTRLFERRLCPNLRRSRFSLSVSPVSPQRAAARSRAPDRHRQNRAPALPRAVRASSARAGGSTRSSRCLRAHPSQAARLALEPVAQGPVIDAHSERSSCCLPVLAEHQDREEPRIHRRADSQVAQDAQLVATGGEVRGKHDSTVDPVSLSKREYRRTVGERSSLVARPTRLASAEPANCTG